MKEENTRTFDDYLDAYEGALRRARKAPGTFRRYAVFLRQFGAWLGQREPSSVSAAEIGDSYMEYWWQTYEDRYGKEPSDDTVRNHYTALSSFYDYLETRDFVSSNPIRKLVRDRPEGKKKRNDFLTSAEDMALLAAPSTPEERIIVNLLRFAGLRAGEAASIKWRDVSLHSNGGFPYGSIRVPEAKTPAGERIIPIFPELRLELSRWQQYQDARDLATPAHPVLASKHGNSFTHDFIWRIVKRVAFHADVRPRPCTCGTKKANQHGKGCPRTKNGHQLSEITPHTLRRTFATALRRDETSLDTISKLLGHSSTKVTEDSYVELEAEVMARELFGAKAGGHESRRPATRSAA